MSKRPPISITINTGQGWPAIQVLFPVVVVAFGLLRGKRRLRDHRMVGLVTCVEATRDVVRFPWISLARISLIERYLCGSEYSARIRSAISR